MPSDPSRKVFKAKSIIKQKAVKKNQKLSQNKENAMVNAQNRKEARLIKKPKSLIPKPSNRLSNSKNLRKGEYQKYIEENKEREKMIPTGLSSRRSSLASNTNRPSKNAPVNKTELLYQKARMALGKNKKPQSKPNPVSKPPLQKRKNEAVNEILRKQEKIRKNFDNRRSFNESSSRNSKNSSN